MNVFLWNLLLALIWTAMSGQFTLTNLLVGLVIGYGSLFLAQPVSGPSPYFMKVYRIAAFFLFFLWELLLANLRVAHDVITPRLRTRPGVVAIPLEAQTDVEITLLANLISMTPGTLSLDVSEDRCTLYLHAMFVDEQSDPEALQRHIKEGFERRLLEILR
jgi:multicomponent Na+:H+ antiporter subunit E